MDLYDLVDDPKEIDEALQSDPEVVEQKLELARAACEYWQSIYPVEDDGRNVPPRPPGTGRDDIHVIQKGSMVAVVNKDPIAHIIEYGDAHFPEYACRARTEAHFNGTGGERRRDSRGRFVSKAAVESE